ncbi:uncharacterized protein LOC134164497 [Pezoporus occidentalis]|uniref:uncharacterized protein LOC134164497 n=1 Tax=Pezoporus occidentalis TaxID=407982 RepID=UPI002F90EA8C
MFSSSLRSAVFHLGGRTAKALPNLRPSRPSSGKTSRPPAHRGWENRGRRQLRDALLALRSAGHRHPHWPPQPCRARSGRGLTGRAETRILRIRTSTGTSREKPSALQPEEGTRSPDSSTPGRVGNFWKRPALLPAVIPFQPGREFPALLHSRAPTPAAQAGSVGSRSLGSTPACWGELLPRAWVTCSPPPRRSRPRCQSLRLSKPFAGSLASVHSREQWPKRWQLRRQHLLCRGLDAGGPELFSLSSPNTARSKSLPGSNQACFARCSIPMLIPDNAQSLIVLEGTLYKINIFPEGELF